MWVELTDEDIVEDSEIVTCRPVGNLGWTCAAILSVCGGAVHLLPTFLYWFSLQGTHKALPPTSTLTWTILVAMVACCWSLAAYNVAHEVRARIITDCKGLRWRNTGKWSTMPRQFRHSG